MKTLTTLALFVLTAAIIPSPSKAEPEIQRSSGKLLFEKADKNQTTARIMLWRSHGDAAEWNISGKDGETVRIIADRATDPAASLTVERKAIPSDYPITVFTKDGKQWTPVMWKEVTRTNL